MTVDTNELREVADLARPRLNVAGHKLREAADEIDRLRTELETLRAGTTWEALCVAHEETATLRALLAEARPCVADCMDSDDAQHGHDNLLARMDAARGEDR